MPSPEDYERMRAIAGTLEAEGNGDDADFLRTMAGELEEESSEGEDGEESPSPLNDSKKGIIITLLKKKKAEREGE